jgi:hypothetical protein
MGPELSDPISSVWLIISLSIIFLPSKAFLNRLENFWMPLTSKHSSLSGSWRCCSTRWGRLATWSTAFLSLEKLDGSLPGCDQAAAPSLASGQAAAAQSRQNLGHSLPQSAPSYSQAAAQSQENLDATHSNNAASWTWLKVTSLFHHHLRQLSKMPIHLQFYYISFDLILTAHLFAPLVCIHWHDYWALGLT